MRRRNHFLLCVFLLFISIISFSFLPLKKPAGTNFIDHYSLDPLPESWKQNKSLIKAIDAIMTSTVQELAQSLACTDCTNSPYSVSLLIDTPVVIKQTYQDIGNKRNSGGYNYEYATIFRFKSSLAVYNSSQHGIAKVMITNPEEDEYTVTKKFNLYYKTGEGKLTPEEYIAKNTTEVGPSMDDMMKYAEKKIYVLRDEIQKLKSRH